MPFFFIVVFDGSLMNACNFYVNAYTDCDILWKWPDRPPMFHLISFVVNGQFKIVQLCNETREKKSFNSFMMNGFVQMIIFNRFFLRFIKGNTVWFFRITKARKITIFLLLAFFLRHLHLKQKMKCASQWNLLKRKINNSKTVNWILKE